MVLKSKQTILSYRCPSCGAGVMSAVDIFKLSADMVKLKCDCGESSMTALYVKDNGKSKIRLTVPCLFCPKPHSFTVSSSVFFNNDLFLLACPYTDMTISAIGEIDKVKAELSRSELELFELIEKLGGEGISMLNGIREQEDEANHEIRETVLSVIKILDSEGNIKCSCNEGEGDYELSVSKDDFTLECKACSCKTTLHVDSVPSAHSLIELSEIRLDPTT